MLASFPGLKACVLLLCALLGLCLGSFLNCMAYRIARGEDFIKGHSKCPACGHPLGFWDLIPVVSYLFLRGRCRYCGARLSPRYILAELIAAAMLLSVVLRYDLSLQALMYGGLLLLLLAAALVDLDTGLVPDGFILAGIFWFLLMWLFSGAAFSALGRALLGGLAVALPLLLLVLGADKLLKRETMGGGDIKLFFMIGLYFDWRRSLLLLIFACLFGILFAGLAKKSRGAEFPFAPAIGAATWAVVLCGAPILAWYIGLF